MRTTESRQERTTKKKRTATTGPKTLQDEHVNQQSTYSLSSYSSYGSSYDYGAERRRKAEAEEAERRRQAEEKAANEALSKFQSHSSALDEQRKNFGKKREAIAEKALSDVQSMSKALNVYTKFVDEGIKKVREDLVKFEGNVRIEQEASAQKMAEHLEHCKSLLSQRNYSSLEQTQSTFQTNFAQQEEQRLAEYESKIVAVIEQLVQKFAEVKKAFDEVNTHKSRVEKQGKEFSQSLNNCANSSMNELEIGYKSVPAGYHDKRSVSKWSRLEIPLAHK